MKLVDRYVHDVTRQLPPSQREDVGQELLSEIITMAEARAKGGKPKKSDIYEVLVDLGSPAKLAESYRGSPRYIIGPAYYETYINIMKTLLIIVVPIVGFLVLMTQLMTTTHNVFEIAFAVIGSALELTVYLVFWMTISFVAVERFSDTKPPINEWKPEDLPELPPVQRIGKHESYFAIAWSVFAIIATLYQIPVVHTFVDNSIPLFFAPAMWPWWTLGLLALSLFSLFAEIVKLKIGGWTRTTVMIIASVNLATIAYFLSLLAFVQPIANPAFTDLIEKTTGFENVAASTQTGVSVFIYFIAAVCCWEIIEAYIKWRKGESK